MKKRMKPVYRKKMFAGGNPDEDTSGQNAYTGSGVSVFTPTGDATSSGTWAPDPGYQGSGNPQTNPWTKVFGQARNVLSAGVPYASNIANAFRKPPVPTAPQLVNNQALSPINLSNARNTIQRSVRGQDLNADRALNPQAAAAVRNANLAKEIEGTSQVSEQEAFLNSRQRAEQAGMNINVDSMNAGATNRYREEVLERNIAGQREQSQNLANASDKYIAQENEQRKEQLDMQKMGVLAQQWQQSGVYNRMLKKMSDNGNTDPTGIMSQMGNAMGGMLRKKEYGGRVYGGGGAPFATGGTIPYTKGTDLEFEQWFRNSTPEGLAGMDLSDTDRDYYSQFKSGKSADNRNPLQIPGASPMSIRRPTMHPSYMADGGDMGDPTGNPSSAIVARQSGQEDASTVDQINRVLAGTIHGIPRFGDDRDKLAMQAFVWRQQNPGRSPEEIIQGFYDRPLDNDPTGQLRQQLKTIGYGPNSMYNNTPNISVHQAFGGFNSAGTKPFGMRMGRATGANMINPFGGSTKGTLGLGAGIPNGKVNVHTAMSRGVKMSGFAWGGITTDFPRDTPDDQMMNSSDGIPDRYIDGGKIDKPGYMDYPVRPKGIRRLDFAGIEHMDTGGYFRSLPRPYHSQGGQMGHIPVGAFEEDHINGPRPTPGPDDTSIGMDIMAKGGKIHIKPSHRGRFTAYKARTGKTTAEALKSPNPHVRQMANFARNFGGHKKATGGMMRPVFC